MAQPRVTTSIQWRIGGNNSLTIAPDGFDTVITTSASTSDSVTLVNYDNSANTLTADDFLFT